MFAYTKLMQAMAAAGVVSATDPYFNLTTLLLNTTATNGAQNNTFLDSSTNNFTITRNGNTTQGTFTPFSQTGWGNYFGGSDYLSFTSSANFAFGTGDYTVETWVYLTSTSTYQTLFGSATTDALMFNIYSMNEVVIQTAGSNIFATFSGATFATNTWYHVAVSRSSGTVKAFVNGVQYGSTITSNTTNYAQPSSNSIGANGASQYFSGYLSNLRVNKGTAVYTSAFTPSTTPLTAISGTQLLTCQSNRFLDNSTNAIALTVNGTPSVQAFSPFLPTAAYSTSAVGGSSYFDGTGDYLSGASNTNLDFGTGDFTVEMFVYVIAYPGSSISLFAGGGSGGGSNINLYVGTNGYVGATFDGAGEDAATAAGAIQQNNWQHVALVRSGNNFTIYINGVSAATGSTTNASTFYGGSGWFVGANGAGANQYLNGYVSSVRVLKGTALYTTTFTPPTAPLTAITNTQLLISATNTGIFDSAAKNDLETVGNAQVSTTQAKWGTTSMYFDGTGDNLSFPSNNLYNFGSGDFTIEFWFYPPSITYGAILYSTNNGSKTDVFALYSYGSGQSPANSIVALVTASGGGAWSLFNNQNLGSTTAATWQHVALVRNGSTFKGYINGVAGFTVTSSSAIASFNGFSIASNGASGDYLTGYIDDLRITRYARYTANFTAPTAAFPLQ